MLTIFWVVELMLIRTHIADLALFGGRYLEKEEGYDQPRRLFLRPIPQR